MSVLWNLPNGKEGDFVGLEIFERGRLPRWLPVRQTLYTEEVGDVAEAVAEALQAPFVAEAIPEGARVALAVGSRGIDRLAEVVAATVAELRRMGAEPFIVPAMGSHGGATAEGQKQLLGQLGVTEEAVGAPIRSSMETVLLGEVEGDVPVYFDRIAATEADVVIPINRVKPHTDFHGPVESGLIKMIAIGLGKQKGADVFHRRGFHTFNTLLPAVARLSVQKINIPFGIALVESGRSRLAKIEAVPAKQMYEREQELIKLAREWLPRLPGKALDVLIIDRIGKDISGIGADTNVVNRYYDGPLPYEPSIQRIIIRDLTDDTEGNASGLGLGDVVLRRAVEKMDPLATYMNCVTAKTPEGARIPLTVDNDRQALFIAIACCLQVTPETARIARIQDTKHLETLWVSEPWWEAELKALTSLEPLAEPTEITFDADGMFVDGNA